MALFFCELHFGGLSEIQFFLSFDLPWWCNSLFSKKLTDFSEWFSLKSFLVVHEHNNESVMFDLCVSTMLTWLLRQPVPSAPSIWQTEVSRVCSNLTHFSPILCTCGLTPIESKQTKLEPLLKALTWTFRTFYKRNPTNMGPNTNRKLTVHINFCNFYSHQGF